MKEEKKSQTHPKWKVRHQKSARVFKRITLSQTGDNVKELKFTDCPDCISLQMITDTKFYKLE